MTVRWSRMSIVATILFAGLVLTFQSSRPSIADDQPSGSTRIDPELQLRELKIKATDGAALVKSGFKPTDAVYRKALNLYNDAKAATNAFVDELADDIKLGNAPNLGANASRAADALITFVQYVRDNTQSAGLLDVLGSVKDLATAITNSGLAIEQRWHDRKAEERDYKAKSLKEGIELPNWDKV